jgi:hypothetical protein
VQEFGEDTTTITIDNDNPSLEEGQCLMVSRIQMLNSNYASLHMIANMLCGGFTR